MKIQLFLTITIFLLLTMRASAGNTVSIGVNEAY